MTKKQLVAISLALVLIFVLAGVDTFGRKVLRKPQRADVVVQGIYSVKCPCKEEFRGSNAIFMKEIWVTLYNDKCGPVYVPATGKIIVTFFNLMTSKNETYTIRFRLKRNETKDFKVVNGKRLARKREGITARVVLDRNFRDCKPANNRRNTRECNPPPLR